VADRALRSILIVGGGASGWMAATLLNRHLTPARCQITVVESAAIGILGVGEATVPPMVAFLRVAGLDEAFFLQACHASFKLGIKFAGWGAPGAPPLWHPFGLVGGTIDGMPLFHHWLRARLDGTEALPFDAYSLQAVAGDALKGPRPAGGGSPITERGAYAYHLDAREFATFLHGAATRRGVRHVVDDVLGAELDERGFIAGVQTRAHGRLEADLYLDCSGFAGLLVGGALGEPWESWSDWLLCDRALAVPLESEGEIAPYTLATALPAGWSWRIPLAHRLGTGYVYSSAFASDDEAHRQLAAHLGHAPEAIEPRRLRMRVGRRREFWVRNCVAIGLAGGFLEPLESTALYLVQVGVEQLIELLPDRDMAPAAAQRYNELVGAIYAEARDFVLLHYLLNGRDEPFWRASRAPAPPASLAASLELYDATGSPGWHHNLFRDTSFHAIAAGLGRLPKRAAPRATFSNAGQVREILSSIRARHAAIVRGLPGHAALLREIASARAAAPARGA